MARTSTRVYIDCAEFPNEANCTLYISGKPDEVLNTAVQHAVSVHGHTDSPELRSEIQSGLKPEAA
jgi:predicted small metal-binding protein